MTSHMDNILPSTHLARHLGHEICDWYFTKEVRFLGTFVGSIITNSCSYRTVPLLSGENILRNMAVVHLRRHMSIISCIINDNSTAYSTVCSGAQQQKHQNPVLLALCDRKLPATDPNSKVHVANMGPTWVLSVPGGPHVGPMNLAIKDDSHKKGQSHGDFLNTITS